jgi:CMP-N,N'-diacetyllegionaminic acid synthase
MVSPLPGSPPAPRAGRPRVLCIIPARGGSKRLPGKNLAPLAGKPLVAHSIEQALAAPSVERVVVSTDDPEIARAARERGAEVIERPAELATDEAPSEGALLHALDTLEAREGYVPDLLLFLQATVPVRRPEDLEAAIATLEREGADSLLSVVESRRFHWREDVGGARPVDYDPRRRPRSQERQPDLVENGSIYLVRPAVLRREGCRLGGRIALYRMGAESAVDVDGPLDLALCAAALSWRDG